MSKNLRITVATGTATVSSSVIFSYMLLTLVSASPGTDPTPVTLTTGPWVAEFRDLQDGNYTVTAQSFDTTGKPIGDPVAQSYTLAPATPADDTVPADQTASVLVPAWFTFELF